MTAAPDYRPERVVRRVTWIGLAVNLLLAGVKYAAGVLGTSQALVADAVHSLSDSVTDVAVLAGSCLWAKSPDAGHPYGHRRIETLVTLFIGLVLLAAGAGIALRALHAIDARPDTHPGWPALAAAAAGIAVKEALYRYTARAGKRVTSTALAANAWHHRLDAVSSLPALAAVGGAMLFPALDFLDAIGAFLVALLILHAAATILLPGVRELLEAGAPPEVRALIRAIAHTHPAVQQVHRIRTRYSGGRLHLDLHLVVNGSLTVRQGHAIAEEVRECIMREGPDVMDVVIHIEPTEARLPPEALDG